MSREDDHGNSSFIFGLVIGAVIGAVIAVVIYKNNKTEVFENLKSKLQEWFDKFFPKSETVKPKRRRKTIAKSTQTAIVKRPVELPETIVAAATKPTSIHKSKPRIFKRK